MSTPTPKHLNVGVVLFPGALPLDFIGPTTLFHTLHPTGPLSSQPPSHTLTVHYLGPTLTPIECSGQLLITPNKTFSQVLDAQQAGGFELDVILLPGGQGARPGPGNEEAREFLKVVVPKVEYVLTVCTGSWLLASTGLLRGERATTNKLAFKRCVEATSDSGVTWIPHGRWITSGKFWSAAGVSAGMDMACAWIKSLIGEENVERVQAWAEYTAAGEDADPWAVKHGL